MLTIDKYMNESIENLIKKIALKEVEKKLLELELANESINKESINKILQSLYKEYN